ncbi:MAG TPA: hypothetical protein VNR38_14000 [Ureibacillus sp.]|nr:hypothetical protein [Ureibacillus sp.]
MKNKLIEKFSVFSKYHEGCVTLYLVYNVGNITLNEIVKTVEDEQEAKLLHHAYYSIMIEREMAIYSLIHFLSKVFDIEQKGKDVKEVVKLINQKAKEFGGVNSLSS